MDWTTLFANPPADVTLRYRTGARRKSPAGEVLLVIRGDGAVILEHWIEDDHAKSTERISRDEVAKLFKLLKTTGFPEVLAQTVPPGPGIIAVEVVGGPEPVSAILHRSFIRDLPHWGALVKALDALAVQVGGPDVTPR
jgi:hypothetical protein